MAISQKLSCNQRCWRGDVSRPFGSATVSPDDPVERRGRTSRHRLPTNDPPDGKTERRRLLTRFHVNHDKTSIQLRVQSVAEKCHVLRNGGHPVFLEIAQFVQKSTSVVFSVKKTWRGLVPTPCSSVDSTLKQRVACFCTELQTETREADREVQPASKSSQFRETGQAVKTELERFAGDRP